MRKIIMFLLIVLFNNICIAQSPQLNELHFNHLLVKNGLPIDAVFTSLEDKEGYMWIGTQAGLVRYDGYTCKVFQFEMEDALHATVISIYEDRSGELWVGTAYEGLYYYNRVTNTFVRYTNYPKNVNNTGAGAIISMHDDRNGNLWIILYDQSDGKTKLNLFDTKRHQFKHFGISEKDNHYINASEYTNLFEDTKGRMWAGANNGIYEYAPGVDKFIPHFASADPSQQKKFGQLTEDVAHPGIIWMSVSDIKSGNGEGLWRYNTGDNTVKSYRHIPKDTTSLGNDTVFVIQKDSQGRLWFRTADGLSLFEPSSERFINYTIKDKKINFNDNAILQLKEDKAGNFWCFNGDNLLSFNTKTKLFTRYTSNEKGPDALPDRDIFNLLIDRSGMPWVGAYEGLYWLNRNRSKFMVYKNDPGQPHYFPGGGFTSFAEDKGGAFWVWSSHGLYHWYPSLDSFMLIKAMNYNDDIRSVRIIEDRNGIVWCSTFGKGLFSYNPKTGGIKNFKNNPKDSTSLSDDYVTRIYEDDKGTLWIGTWRGGLCSFNQQTNTFKRYPFIINQINTPNNNALDDQWVMSICEDKQGVLWIGTDAGGLNRFNRETGTFTSYQNQLPGFMTITNIFEDSKGHLWAGTYLGGLFLFDRKTNIARKFTEKDGLLYDGAIGINEDKANNLWITSQRGISIMNLQTNKISHLGTDNGLPEELEQYNTNFFRASDGRFLMPCNNGFISFDPEQLKADTTLPVIHIESIEIGRRQTVGNKQTDSIINSYSKNNINLRYNENRITFNYVGLQYQNSQLNQYAYKLDGYDKDWIPAGTQRKVTYTNLSPGTYIFHVKAANSDGVWNPQEQTLTIIISPPWWRTWWAYLLYALVFAGAVWAFIVYRSKSLKRENIILEEKVVHRTTQLKQSLEDLKVTQSQLIQSEKMASLGELTAGIAHEIQNPLNFVNNFSEVNKELIEEVKSQKSKLKSEELDELLNDIAANEEKINHHGRRADAIVKGMLQHSRQTSGTKEPTNINALCDEYLRLSYHGLRAKNKDFNADFKTDFDEGIGNINVVPQDIGRVLLNLYNNAFYAVAEREKKEGEGYEPTVSVSTKRFPLSPGESRGEVIISVKDNGSGISQKVIDKIFQPFFTTKPTGQGTGLGLSLSYDIIKVHGGKMKVESKEGEGSTFIIKLPTIIN